MLYILRNKNSRNIPQNKIKNNSKRKTMKTTFHLLFTYRSILLLLLDAIMKKNIIIIQTALGMGSLKDSLTVVVKRIHIMQKVH